MATMIPESISALDNVTSGEKKVFLSKLLVGIIREDHLKD